MTNIKTQECVKFALPNSVEGKSMLTDSDIPQAQEMISLTECVDDEGTPLSSSLRATIEKGLVIPYLRYPSGVEEFTVSTRRDGSVVSVPRGTTFLRDSVRGQTLGGLPRMSGGSI